MLTSGVPASSTLQKLLPKNINMDTTGWLDYFTNDLNPAKQADFVKEMLKMAARVRQVSKDTNKEYVKELVSGTSDLRAINPEQYDLKMKRFHLDPEEVDELIGKTERASVNEPKKELPRAENFYWTPTPTVQPVTNLTGDKKSRLEELRRKKAEGTLR